MQAILDVAVEVKSATGSEQKGLCSHGAVLFLEGSGGTMREQPQNGHVCGLAGGP